MLTSILLLTPLLYGTYLGDPAPSSPCKPEPHILAAFYNDADAFKAYVENGGDVNADRCHRRPMQLFLIKDNTEMYFYMLEHGAKIDDYTYKQVLGTAFSKKHEMVIQDLLNHHMLDSTKRVQETFYLAAANNRFDIADQTIKHGADVNAAGNSLLFNAITEGNIERVEYLLINGIDVNHERTGIPSSIPIHNAVLGGNLPIVKLLIENGADVNCRGGALLKGATPLILSVKTSNRSVKLSDYLLSKGADLSMKDDTGKTALDYLHSRYISGSVQSQFEAIFYRK